MKPHRTCLFALFVATIARTQDPLADGVTSFIGAGTQVAWFEKGASIWVSDGTPLGTRDTGVPIGLYSVGGDGLIVYRASRIDRMNPDGSTTVLTPPFVWDGFDEDAPEPLVWRLVSSRTGAQGQTGHLFLQLARWSPSGWATSIVGVLARDGGEVEAPIPRGGHYTVLWDSGISDRWSVSDLFDPTNPPECRIASDWISRPTFWSGGVAFQVTGPDYRPRVLIVPDHGAAWQAPLAAFGSIGNYGDFIVREFSPGFLIASRYASPISIAVGAANAASFPLPTGTIHELLWCAPTEELIALVDAGGSRSVRWFDRAAGLWNPTSGFETTTDLDYLGSFGGSAYLVTRQPSGPSLVRYDASAHTATAIAQNLAVASTRLSPFGRGFLFAADEGVHGTELWFSDGTQEGTRMVADLRDGSLSSRPRSIARVGDRVVFSTDSPSGMTLWSLETLHLDWQRNPSTGRYYRLTAPGSWVDVRRDARNFGGELATMRSAVDQAWIESRFGREDYWIGLSDLDGDGTFVWCSGDPVGYANWCPGQPDRRPGETVVLVTHEPPNCVSGWKDEISSAVYRGLVERDTAPTGVESFGSGCSASPLQPVAELQWTGGWPRAGGHVDLTLTLGTGYLLVGALLLGTDATEYGGRPLPLALDSLGAPHCSLHLRLDDAYALDPFNHWQMQLSLPIPNLPQIEGSLLFLQGLGIEYSRNEFAGVRTSNAVRISIGS